MGKNEELLVLNSDINLLNKLNIYLVMNFIPVMPAGNDDANNHAKENIFRFNLLHT